jgi:hypothetical protein
MSKNKKNHTPKRTDEPRKPSILKETARPAFTPPDEIVGEAPKHEEPKFSFESSPPELPAAELTDNGESTKGESMGESVKHTVVREMKDFASNGGRKMKEEATRVKETISDAARSGSKLVSLDSARRIATIVIDANEDIGKQMVELDERMAELTQGTPIAPVFRVQAGVRRRIVEASSKLARSIFRVDSGHQPHAQ